MKMEEVPMRKLSLLIMVLALAAATTTVALAGGNSLVQYTFTFTDLGQPGAHGGGPLYADGSANVHMTLSAMNGQAIFRLQARSWSEVVPGESVDICFDAYPIKGPPLLPPSFCFSDFGIVLPVSGTPVVISNPFADEALVRVTPAN
jgi:hypothetical protein